MAQSAEHYRLKTHMYIEIIHAVKEIREKRKSALLSTQLDDVLQA